MLEFSGMFRVLWWKHSLAWQRNWRIDWAQGFVSKAATSRGALNGTFHHPLLRAFPSLCFQTRLSNARGHLHPHWHFGQNSRIHVGDVTEHFHGHNLDQLGMTQERAVTSKVAEEVLSTSINQKRWNPSCQVPFVPRPPFEVRVVSRLAMLAGSSSALSMASSRMARCPATRPLAEVMMPSTRSLAYCTSII